MDLKEKEEKFLRKYKKKKRRKKDKFLRILPFFRKFCNKVRLCAFHLPRPHLLPEIELSDNYFHVTVRKIKFEFDKPTIIPDLKSGFKDIYSEGFIKLSSEIIIEDLLSLVIKTSSYRPIILITDKIYYEIINRSLPWLTIKNYGISCIFLYEDYVSNDLTEDMHVIYLINQSSVNFDKQLEDIKRRSCESCQIFLCSEPDPLDINEIKRVNKLEEIIERFNDSNSKTKKDETNDSKNSGKNNCNNSSDKYNSDSGLLSVSLINPIDARVVSLTEETYSSYLYNILLNKKEDDKEKLLTNKLALKLVSLLDKMNIFPVIRYYKSCHQYNKIFAEYLINSLLNLKSQRTVPFVEDTLLIVLDRCVDLLTPIVHSNTYQSFIVQELEMIYEFDPFYNELKDCPIDKICDQLIQTSKMFLDKYNNNYNYDNYYSNEYYYYYNYEKNNINQFLRKHTDNILCLTQKLNNGYKSLLEIENELINSNIDNFKLLKLFIKESSDKISLFDIFRLVVIYSLITNKIRKRFIRKAVKSYVNCKDNYDKIIKFIKNVIKIVKLNESRLKKKRKFCIIENIVNCIEKGEELNEELYPFFNNSKHVIYLKNPQKIMIFVRGGLSYNEIKYVQNKNLDVTMCCDALITPREFMHNLQLE